MCSAGAASAANRFWVSGGSCTAVFADTNCWAQVSGGATGFSVPTSADAVTFDGGGTGNCSINANLVVASMSILAGYTGTVTVNTTGGNPDVRTTGNFSLQGGTFNLNGNKLGVASIPATGMTGGTFTTGTGGTVTSTGSVTVNGTAFNGTAGSLSATTFTLTSGTFNVGALSTTSTFAQAGGTFNAGGGMIGIVGAITMTGGTFNAGTSAVTMTSLTVNGATTLFNAGSTSVSNSGSTTISNSVSGGTFDAQTAALTLTGNVAIGTTAGLVGTMSLGTRTQALGGTVTVYGAGSTLSAGSSTTTISGAVTVDYSGALNGNSASLSVGSLTVGNAARVAAVTLGSALLATTTGNLSINGAGTTFSAGSGTLSVAGTTTVSNSAVFDGQTTTTMAFTGGVTVGSTTLLTGTMSLSNGTVTMGSTLIVEGTSTVFNANGANLTVTGAVTVDYTGTFNGNTATLHFNGAGSGFAVGSNAPRAATVNLGSSNLSVAVNLTVNGTGTTFNAGSGTVAVSGTTTVSYDASFDGQTASSITLTGNVAVGANTPRLGTFNLDMAAMASLGGTLVVYGTGTVFDAKGTTLSVAGATTVGYSAVINCGSGTKTFARLSVGTGTSATAGTFNVQTATVNITDPVNATRVRSGSTFDGGTGSISFATGLAASGGTTSLATATALAFSAGVVALTGGNVTLGSQTVSIPSITASSGTFSAASPTLTVTGLVNLTTTGALQLTGGTLSIGATLNVQNTAVLTIGAASLSVTGATTFQTGVDLSTASGLSFAALTVSAGTTTFPNGKTITMANGTVSGSGILNVGSSTINVSGDLQTTGGTLQTTGATVNVAGSLKITSGTFTPGTVRLTATTAATFGQNSDLSGALSLSFPGTMTVSGNTTTFGTQAVSIGALSVTGGVFTSTGAVTLTMGSVSTSGGTFSPGASSVMTVSGGYGMTGGTFTPGASASLSVTGAMAESGGTFNAGTLAFSVGSWTLNGGAAFNGGMGSLAVAGDTNLAHTVNCASMTSVSFGGALNISAGTLTLGNSQTVSPTSLTMTGGGFTPGASTVHILGAASINPGTLTTASTTQTIAGTFQVFSGATFTPGNVSLTVTGDTTFGASANLSTATLVSLNAALTVSGGTTTFGAQAINIPGATSLTGGNLTLGTGVVTLSTLTISSGTFTSANGVGTMTVGGAFLMTGGAFAGSSGTSKFNSDGQHQGLDPLLGSTFGAGSGTVRFMGAVNVGGNDNTPAVFHAGAATISFEVATNMVAPDSLVVQGPSTTTFDNFNGAAKITFGLNAAAGTNAIHLASGTMDFQTTAGAILTFSVGNVQIDAGTTYKSGSVAETFPATTTVTIAGTFSGGTGTLTFGGPVPLTGPFSSPGLGTRVFSSPLAIGAGATFTSSTGLHTFTGAVSTDGTFDISLSANTPVFSTSLAVTGGTTTFASWGGNTVTIPTLIVSGGTLDAATVAGGAKLTISGASSFSGGTANLASSRVITLSGAVTVSGTAVVALGLATACAVTDAIGSTVSVSGGSFAAGGSCTVTVASGVSVSGGTMTLGSGTTTLSTTLAVPGGTFSAGAGPATITGAATVDTAGTLNGGASSNLRFNSTLVIGSATPTAGTFNSGAAVALFSGAVVVQQGSAFNSALVANAGTLTFASTTAVQTASTFNVAGSTTTFSGVFSLLGSSTFNGGTGTTDFTVAPTLTSGTFTVGAAATTGKVTFHSSTTFTGGVTLAFPSSGGELRLSQGKNLTVSGPVTAATTLGATKPKIDCSGCSASQGVGITFSASSKLNVDGLEFDNATSAGVTIASGATYTLLKNLKFQNNAANGSGGTHLAVTLGTAVINVPGCFFDATTTTNVTLNGTAGQPRGARASFVFQSTAVNGSGAGESRDADGDSNDDNYGDNLAAPYYGSVIEWVNASPTDTTGTAVGFPTAAFDWNTFQFYGIYVAYKDTSGAGTSDRLWLRNNDGSPKYSFTIPQSSGDLVGTPLWDSLNETLAGMDINGNGNQTDTDVRIVYLATTGGHIIKLIDSGAGLAPPASGPWASDFTSASVSTISSPLVNDGTNLYFGGTGSATTKVFGVQIAGGANEATLQKNVGSVSAVTTKPSFATNGGSTYVFLGSTATASQAYIYRINMTNGTVDASFSGVTTNVNGAHLARERPRLRRVRRRHALRARRAELRGGRVHEHRGLPVPDGRGQADHARALGRLRDQQRLLRRRRRQPQRRQWLGRVAHGLPARDLELDQDHLDAFLHARRRRHRGRRRRRLPLLHRPERRLRAQPVQALLRDGRGQRVVGRLRPQHVGVHGRLERRQADLRQRRRRGRPDAGHSLGETPQPRGTAFRGDPSIGVFSSASRDRASMTLWGCPTRLFRRAPKGLRCCRSGPPRNCSPNDTLARALGVAFVLALLLSPRAARAGATEVQDNTVVATTTTQSSVTGTLTGVTVGNLIVALVTMDSNATITAPSGWINPGIRADSGANVGIALYYYPSYPSTSVSAKFTFSVANGSGIVQLIEIAGALATSPLDVSGSAADQGRSATVSTSSATTASGDIAILGWSSSTTRATGRSATRPRRSRSSTTIPSRRRPMRKGSTRRGSPSAPPSPRR